jgi:hypothetical protein
MKTKIHEVIWLKKDNFESIRNKLFLLKGLKVKSNNPHEKQFTIFDVSLIYESQMIIVVPSNSNSLQLSDSTGIGFSQKVTDVWVFTVKFGHESNGFRQSMEYRFMIPRTKYGLESDMQKTTLVQDCNHPFMNYE